MKTKAMLSEDKKKQIISVIIIAVALSAIVFCFAFPETFKPQSNIFARDFSAYYIGEWRLFHNPTAIYLGRVQPGDYQIIPAPQIFKYTPSFLILFAPFLSLSYQDALSAFDIVQLALIPALTFFVYKMVKDKNIVYATIASIIILIEPLGYYVGYASANAHILQTSLLVGALYFGFVKNPRVSALLFAFGSFDPRAALFTLPLLVWFNRKKILPFIAGAASFVTIANLPFFFYDDIGFTFLRIETNGSIISQMYAYDWLPLSAVVTLTVIEIISYSRNMKTSLNFPLTREKAEKAETPKERIHVFLGLASLIGCHSLRITSNFFGSPLSKPMK